LRIPGKLCAKHFVLGVQRKLNNYVILISAFVLILCSRNCQTLGVSPAKPGVYSD
jgi:hypothetical protein